MCSFDLFIKSVYHKKFRNIKFILSHAGGILPVIIDTVLDTLEKQNTAIRDEAEEFFTQVYVDTAKSR